MRFAYADPPYIGQAKRHYGSHPDFAGEVDHEALISRLVDEYPDGWALSLSAQSLQTILAMCPRDVRVLAWTKTMAHFIPSIRLQYTWEPVILRGGRQPKPTLHAAMVRDSLVCHPQEHQYRRAEPGHVIGRKPRAFCEWVFNCLGARNGDTLDDVFPGSGAVAQAWARWSDQLTLEAS